MSKSTFNISTSKNNPIDVVISWVDGNDLKFQEKMENYISSDRREAIPGAQKTRFGNVNELKYCVLSILTFAPFVRKIFIVTNEQTPPIIEDINPYFPERIQDINIVDHTEIFEGFEEFLPVFNSRSIESMIWKIKGLSDNFVYFNDDMLLIKPVQSDDWFVDERPVIRGSWMPSAEVRLRWDKVRSKFQRKIMGKSDFEPRASFHTGQWNAAKILGFRWRYFVLEHTPHAVQKQTVRQFFDNNTALVKKNIAFRFRHYSQFNFLSLSYHLEILDGNNNISTPALAYLQPLRRPKNYIDKKINLCESNPDIIYMCVQSLDLCDESDINKIFGWLEKIMSLKKES